MLSVCTHTCVFSTPSPPTVCCNPKQTFYWLVSTNKWWSGIANSLQLQDVATAVPPCESFLSCEYEPPSQCSGFWVKTCVIKALFYPLIKSCSSPVVEELQKHHFSFNMLSSRLAIITGKKIIYLRGFHNFERFYLSTSIYCFIAQCHLLAFFNGLENLTSPLSVVYVNWVSIHIIRIIISGVQNMLCIILIDTRRTFASSSFLNFRE